MEDFLSCVDKPCVILAGAGTGKTRTISDKVTYLVKNKIFSPGRIACVTFSNEAVDSLHKRLVGMVGEQAVPIVRTFHGLCGDLLREYGEKIGISKKFKIITPEDGMIMLYQYFKTIPIRCSQYIEAIGALKESSIMLEKYESFLKNSAKDFPDNPEAELEKLTLRHHSTRLEKEEKDEIKKEIERLGTYVQQRRFLQSWRGYEKIKLKYNMLDYSDLHYYALKLLEKEPSLASNFGYLIVDEFQDTNKIQLDLLFALAPRGNITIVGDLNQSIYQFRGAYGGTFDEFKKRYGKTEFVKLDKSHRSPNKILKVAHKAIENNYKDKDECFSVLNAREIEGEKVNVIELLDSKEEVRKIVEIIESEIKSGVLGGEICVLFRTHNQANLLKKALQGRGIVFSSSKRQSLLAHTRIELIRNLCVILDKIFQAKSGGSNAWWGFAKIQGIDGEELGKFGKYVREHKGAEGLSLYLLKNVPEIFSNESKKKFEIMQVLLRELEKLKGQQLSALIANIASRVSREEDGENAIIQTFTEYAKEFSEREYADLESFLAHLDARTHLGLDLAMPKAKSEGVRIMTAHATKGLEYEIVIIANLVQGKFPITTISGNKLIPADFNLTSEEEQEEQQLAEERRLFYVACTRTKKRLYLTYAQKYGAKNLEVSQFLNEIDFKNNENVTFLRDLDKTEEIDSDFGVTEKIEVKKDITFSPSALNLFKDCQKKYEYKYVFNMPEEIVTWEQRSLGSFVHLIIEEGVKELFTSDRQFISLAEQMALKAEWRGVNLKEAEHLLKIFFERNKNKYNKESKNEQSLFLSLDGLRFIGYADRIDFHLDWIEIIDYKTGAHVPYGRERDWQLGFYALAAQRLGNVKRVTLDVFKNEKPLEYEIDNMGIARDSRSNRMAFSLHEVRKEIIEAAKEILECYKKGFAFCKAEKNCEFCAKIEK
ncbi:MAG: ATP-dependent DNA helicase [Nanoarchaeota archaeon]